MKTHNDTPEHREIIDAYFIINNDSMENNTNMGLLKNDILKCKEIEPDSWNDIKMLNPILIKKKEGVVVGKIIRYDPESKTVYLTYLNPKYPDTKIELREAEKVYSIEYTYRHFK